MSLTRIEVMRAFVMLEHADYDRRNKGITIEQLSERYAKALRTFDGPTLLEATERFIAESGSPYWPKPSELVEWCRRVRRSRPGAKVLLPEPGPTRPDRLPLAPPPDVMARGWLAIAEFYLGPKPLPPDPEEDACRAAS